MTSCLDLDCQGSGWPRAWWHVLPCGLPVALEPLSCAQAGVMIQGWVRKGHAEWFDISC